MRNMRLEPKNIPSPRKVTCHWKRGHFKRNIVFQPLFFWGHVSFQGCTISEYFVGLGGVLVLQKSDVIEILAWKSTYIEHSEPSTDK